MSTLQQKSFVVVVFSAGTNENVLFFVARHRSCSISFHLLYYLIRRRDETTRCRELLFAAESGESSIKWFHVMFRQRESDLWANEEIQRIICKEFLFLGSLELKVSRCRVVNQCNCPPSDGGGVGRRGIRRRSQCHVAVGRSQYTQNSAYVPQEHNEKLFKECSSHSQTFLCCANHHGVCVTTTNRDAKEVRLRLIVFFFKRKEYKNT